ncbi:zinc finger protein 43-like [Macrosteles quadrilineatus]|uniref:zinc finger protein 43-like n=1 Tax=Macrosteles quadrilineatus TaxID=74068 RepID=UPI0023E0AAC9|nr:zinc finger protein 43-like [Macrosteles quadrilineatus]
MNSIEEDEERTPTASSWLLPVEPEVEIEELDKSWEICEEEMMEGSSEPEEKSGFQAVRELESELIDKMCEICGNFFKTFELVNPEARKPLLSTCETCSYYITPPVTCIYSKNILNDYSCDKCSQVFEFKNDWLRHKATHNNSKQFSCDMCDDSFKKRYELTEHIKLAHLKEDKCVKDRCIACGTFENIIQLNVGENEAEFIKLCEVCNISRQEKLANISRNGSNGFSCDLCFKQFSRRDHALRHRLSHLNVKPFKCSICQKSFSRNDRLQRHRRTHPGAKPYPCRFCSEAFINCDELKGHVMLKHETLNAKVVSVQKLNAKVVDGMQKQQTPLKDRTSRLCVCLCGKKFKQNKALLVHQKKCCDLNYIKCKTCGKKFKNKEILNRHALIHTSAKAYSCTICSKVFLRKDKLKTHHLIHIDIKPYSCHICNSSFKRKDKLSRHLREVHFKMKE